MTDIRKLDLNLLKVFSALLDERSVTQAAARLSLTQPAVSGMLTRLRESFDDPLFVRTARGVVPTQRALELAPTLKRVLADVETMLQPAHFDPACAEFSWSVAGTDYSLQAVVVPFLARLRRLAPGIRVMVHPIDDGAVLRQLERGALDLVLTTPEVTPAELHQRPLYDEEYVCVLRTDHPVLAEGLTLERFCALDHALVSYSGGGLSGSTDRALAELGLRRRVALSVPSFLVLLEVLRGSDLLAMMPRRLVDGVSGVCVVPAPLWVPGFTKVMAWHERTHSNPAQRWLRELLLETCGTDEMKNGA
ncbi:LysR family transcriptional regulator [Aeromonas simiae]|uniref:LysR family transcriptional regulator n=1 Tax=Aeromonas simiae TaxID=218936 RepID=A0A5J6X2J1_9GAMM|nr:LysR family transcriptional regulator [Aeromonas simiae]QFI56383.1 LysR family transcriptional regulator [Aeromonas simiae]